MASEKMTPPQSIRRSLLTKLRKSHALGETQDNCNEIAQRAQSEIEQKRQPAIEPARPTENNQLEHDDRSGNENAGDATLNIFPDAVVRRVKMPEGGPSTTLIGIAHKANRGSSRWCAVSFIDPRGTEERFVAAIGYAQYRRIPSPVYRNKRGENWLEGLQPCAPLHADWAHRVAC